MVRGGLTPRNRRVQTRCCSMKRLPLEKRFRDVSGFWSCLIRCALVSGLLGITAFADDGPAITDVTVAFIANHGPQLTIIGSGFGTLKPTVTIDKLTLSVSTYTDTNVVAELAPSVNLPPGSYTVTLRNTTKKAGDPKGSTTFIVTLGAVGAMGPAGPAGSAA